MKLYFLCVFRKFSYYKSCIGLYLQHICPEMSCDAIKQKNVVHIVHLHVNRDMNSQCSASITR